MTGKYYKRLIEAEKLQRQAEPFVLDFLKLHKNENTIFENTKNVQIWLPEIYPAILDESEQDEEIIAAFIAGMLFLLINAQADSGIRWIYALPPIKEDDNEE